MNDYQLAVEMDKTISLLFDKLIDSWGRRNKVLVKKVATVASYDGVFNTATVYFPPDNINQSCSFLNRTNQILSAGDFVYIFCEYGNVSQGWIYEKK
ncbi:MAG: hypothetical protein APF84_12540 [Gracilibacter sp. BRH_c7a]|nr:MAG: hypothetical protein APF84_12540 [Gracilibacter sp. BRH_c7a]